MADLDDIQIPPLSEMGTDEALEHIRQIRLSRRTPVKQVSKSTTSKRAKAKETPKLTAEQALEILKSLEVK
jgi:hypothetical protein